MYEDIIEEINEKKYSEVKEKLMTMNEADIAELLENIEEEPIVVKIFRLLPKDLAAEVFSYFHTHTQQNILEKFNEKEIYSLIEESYFDDVIDLIEEMPASVVQKIMKTAKKSTRKLINRFLQYPEDTAGSLMTIEYIDLKEDMTIKEATEYIKKLSLDDEHINVCYVTDEKRFFKGIVPLPKIILLDDQKLIKDIMEEKIVAIKTNDTSSYCTEVFKKYDIVTAPVVDMENRLVGIITIDDIVDVIEQEATEDIQMLAGITPLEKGYLETDVFNLAKNRVVWLLVLMVSATLSGMVLEGAQEFLSTFTILVTFLPMLMGTGGNSGSQASTLVIRELSLGELTLKDIYKVIWKEARVGFIVGLVLAIVNYIRIILFGNIDFHIALVVCITLIFAVMVAKMIGGVLPILAKMLKLDPALMAAPLISTMSDVMVLLIYLSVAKIILAGI